MSSKQNKAIVRRANEELWNGRNAEAVDEFWAAEYINPAQQEARAAWKEDFVLPILAAAPADLHLAIEDLIAERDKVVMRFAWSFTHTVRFLGANPTGKHIAWTGIAIFRLKDGKIIEEWANTDNLGLNRQLGLIA